MDGDVGHAGADLDERDAELALLAGEDGEARRRRRGDHRPDAEMGAADGEVEVADRRRVGGDDVDVHAEPVGVEADGVFDEGAVDRVQRRLGVEDGPAAGVDPRAAGGEQRRHVGVGDLVAADVDLDRLDLAAQAAGAHVDIDGAGLDPGVALGLVDRGADRAFGLLHVGDEAAADAVADALADADDARLAGADEDDQRGDLRRADVEDGDGALAAAGGTRGLRRGHIATAALPLAGGLTGVATRTVICPGWRRSKRA